MSRMCPTFHTMSAVRATFSHQVTLHEKCSTLKKKKNCVECTQLCTQVAAQNKIIWIQYTGIVFFKNESGPTRFYFVKTLDEMKLKPQQTHFSVYCT